MIRCHNMVCFQCQSPYFSPNFCGVCVLIPFLQEINVQKFQGPDNPTSQLLPIMSFKGCSGGKEGKTKEVVKDREVE